jgi:hypothetical protein
MKDCQQCHAADFSGGIAKANCLNCHTSPEGPEACNTCHGDFSNPSRPAPPKDINDNTATTFKSVGAHSVHLFQNQLGNSTPCSSCHKTPNEIYETGHIDSDLPAEVMLKDIAAAFGADDAIYDPSTGTCSNTYCHGNFEFLRSAAPPENQFAYRNSDGTPSEKMTGINNMMDWTKIDGTKLQCGTCHGLPPAGHLPAPLDACYTCHPGVVDEQGNIADYTKHINGEINARGTQAEN